jgi:hypothetical protein
VGGDRVLADCQDGSGTNNANFFTPQDGQSGRMQQYVFTGPSPARDSDLDSDIVYHEYSHGLSTRLHGGFVFGEQAGGMGEGWGDFFGVCLNAEPGDDPNAVYCVAGHTMLLFAPGFVDNYYFGIRRFPYSTDPNKNPQTYADTDPSQQSYPPSVPRSPIFTAPADEVHNVGEVWCNMLLECRANLVATHGFAGNDLVMQLVTDGMKNDPGTPNFLQARDGILLADLVANGGANLGELWRAFAKRGCGFSATSPSGSTTSGVVEAFDVPVFFDYPAGKPAQLPPSQPTTFQVNVSGVGSLQPLSGSGFLHVSVNGGPFVAIPMLETSTNHYDATLPAGIVLRRVPLLRVGGYGRRDELRPRGRAGAQLRGHGLHERDRRARRRLRDEPGLDHVDHGHDRRPVGPRHAGRGPELALRSARRRRRQRPVLRHRERRRQLRRRQRRGDADLARHGHERRGGRPLPLLPGPDGRGRHRPAAGRDERERRRRRVDAGRGPRDGRRYRVAVEHDLRGDDPGARDALHVEDEDPLHGERRRDPEHRRGRRRRRARRAAPLQREPDRDELLPGRRDRGHLPVRQPGRR